MKSTRLLVATVLAATGIFSAEREAHALGPIDLEVAGKVGGGTNPDSNGANPYGVGVGARGGIGISNLWLGVGIMHYFGGSVELAQAKIDYSSTLVGGEVGYTIKAIPVIDIRPQIGVGNATFSADVGSASTSTSKLYLEPGVTVLIPLGLLFVGADANALIIPGVDTPSGDSKTYTSFTIHGQLGVRL